jgi:LPXTG-site transpeptidase (sortase) family protein
MMNSVSLSKINNLLLALIILVDGYIVLAPFAPAILWHWQDHSATQRKLESQLHAPRKPAAPQPNQLIVPSMGLDQPIYDGPGSQQYSILNKGIWRFSYASTPDKGGNTVLIGHRFTYTNPRGVFYYLNKIKMGDEIGVWWNNKQYLYKVASINEVPPTDTAIENATTQPELTLFTCTPLWLPKDRLVVVADLETTP